MSDSELAVVAAQTFPAGVVRPNPRKFRQAVCHNILFDRDESDTSLNSKIIITLFSLFSELERDLISLRTKEALSAKRAQGQILGEPKGTLQKSKFNQTSRKSKNYSAMGSR